MDAVCDDHAEELGVTSKNIDEALKSKKPDVMRLVGTEGALWRRAWPDQGLGRAHYPPRRNYGEIYERNVGADRS